MKRRKARSFTSLSILLFFLILSLSGFTSCVVDGTIAVTITNPSDGDTFELGDTITFSGTAVDSEEGDLTGSSLVWTSDKDGQIGTGKSFARDDLSEDSHTITLTATDSDSTTETASVSITIENKGFTPPPEELVFSEYSDEMSGGGAFAIDDDVYMVFNGWIYKLGAGGFEQHFDTGEDTLVLLSSFNVEVLNDKAYIVGGSKNDGCKVKVPSGEEYNCSTDEVWIYDPFEDTLTLSDAHLNNAREVFASGIVDGKIYVLGGWYPNETGGNESTVEVFEGGAWKLVSYTGTYMPVRSPAYATVGDKIYLFGGCLYKDEGGPSSAPCTRKDVQIFDTKTSTFSQGTPMSLDGRHFSGQHTAVRGKYVYVFGGATDHSDEIFDDVAVYDTEADKWMTLANRMTRERKSTGAVVSSDTLYVFGGLTCDPPGVCPGEGGDKTGANSIETGTFVSTEY